jgi:hypothetical protein
MMMQMVGAFAEFERSMFRESTKAGSESLFWTDALAIRRPKLTIQPGRDQAYIVRGIKQPQMLLGFRC